MQILLCDAGALLRVLRAEAFGLHHDDPEIALADFWIHGLRIRIEHPSCRIFCDEVFVGKGFLLSNGVGRLVLTEDASEACVQCLQEICSPCTCRAGHLLVLRLRHTNRLACVCTTSFLRCLKDSIDMTGRCPVSHERDTPFRVLQNYAICVADQRARIHACVVDST